MEKKECIKPYITVQNCIKTYKTGSKHWFLDNFIRFNMFRKTWIEKNWNRLKFNWFWNWFLITIFRIQFDCFRVKIDRNRLNTIQIQILINWFDRFETISINFNSKTIKLNFEKQYQESVLKSIEFQSISIVFNLRFLAGEWR